MSRYLSVAVALTLLTLSACGVGGDTTVVSNNDLRPAQPDLSDQLFQPNEIVQVDIKMDPDDYDILRNEGRYFATIATGMCERI